MPIWILAGFWGLVAGAANVLGAGMAYLIWQQRKRQGCSWANRSRREAI